jgi:hypothetical protein
MTRRRTLLLAVPCFWSGCLCSQIPNLSVNFGLDGGIDAGASVDAGSGDGGEDAGARIDAGSRDGGGDGGQHQDAGSGDGGDAGGAVCLPDAGPLPPPIAYWALNEGSGVTVGDSSGNGNSGTLLTFLADGGDLPMWTAQGRYCGGLFLNGQGGYVDFGFGTGDDLKITGSMTVSAWYRYESLPASMSDMPILSKRGVPDRGWELYLDGSDGSVVFDVAIDAVNYVRQYGAASSAQAWHHLIGVYDAPNLALFVYLDGISYGPTVMDAGVQHDSQWPVHMGVAGSCPTQPCTQLFNGTIDEVRVWNVALTPIQVASIP